MPPGVHDLLRGGVQVLVVPHAAARVEVQDVIPHPGDLHGGPWLRAAVGVLAALVGGTALVPAEAKVAVGVNADTRTPRNNISEKCFVCLHVDINHW